MISLPLPIPKIVLECGSSCSFARSRSADNVKEDGLAIRRNNFRELQLSKFYEGASSHAECDEVMKVMKSCLGSRFFIQALRLNLLIKVLFPRSGLVF